MCDKIAILVNGGVCCHMKTLDLAKLTGGFSLTLNYEKLLRTHLNTSIDVIATTESLNSNH